MPPPSGMRSNHPSSPFSILPPPSPALSPSHPQLHVLWAKQKGRQNKRRLDCATYYLLLSAFLCFCCTLFICILHAYALAFSHIPASCLLPPSHISPTTAFCTHMLCPYHLHAFSACLAKPSVPSHTSAAGRQAVEETLSSCLSALSCACLPCFFVRALSPLCVWFFHNLHPHACLGIFAPHCLTCIACLLLASKPTCHYPSLSYPSLSLSTHGADMLFPKTLLSHTA